MEQWDLLYMSEIVKTEAILTTPCPFFSEGIPLGENGGGTVRHVVNGTVGFAI
jgi:hypothetical protein